MGSGNSFESPSMPEDVEGCADQTMSVKEMLIEWKYRFLCLEVLRLNGNGSPSTTVSARCSLILLRSLPRGRVAKMKIPFKVTTSVSSASRKSRLLRTVNVIRCLRNRFVRRRISWMLVIISALFGQEGDLVLETIL
jgi:hypothetical protein